MPPPSRSSPAAAPSVAAARVLLLLSALSPIPLHVSALDISWSCCDENYGDKYVTQDEGINFILAAGANNVWEFRSKAAFDTCDFSQADFKGGAATTMGAPVRVPTPAAGVTRYFGARVGTNCRMDEWPQKVAVTVEAALAAQGGGGGGGLNDQVEARSGDGGAGGCPADGSRPCPPPPGCKDYTCKLKVKTNKYFYCDDSAYTDADVIKVKNKVPKFKTCLKECIKKNPDKCRGYQHDLATKKCILFNKKIPKGTKEPNKKIMATCGQFQKWITKVKKTPAAAASMARPATATAATFERYESSLCEGNLLGKIVKGGAAQTCEAKCGGDDTCLGYEFNSFEGTCKLLDVAPRKAEGVAEGHVCAARTATNA